MKITIEVANKKEGELVRAAMGDAAARAFIVVTGALLGLESDRARHRLMTFVKDYFEERDAREVAGKTITEALCRPSVSVSEPA